MGICYIVGAMKTDYEINKREGDVIIAADSGYENLHGLNADFVVGDFDSLGYVPSNENVFAYPVHKDDTDTMIALKTGLERGYKRFVISGATGGRLDHTFANIQTLAYAMEHGARACLAEKKLSVVLLSDGTLHIDNTATGRISVFSYGEKTRGVTLCGLEYPLENALLSDSFPLGVSNAFTGNSADISVKEGRLLVMWEDSIDKSDYLCND